MSSVYPLFSYPVMVCSETYGFTDAEIRFIDSLAMAENVGNAMSEDDHLLERIVDRMGNAGDQGER